MSKNDAIDCTKNFINQEWLVVESCPTARWIAFLMLYWLVYNIRSHLNELILAWSAYLDTQDQNSARGKKILTGSGANLINYS